MVTSIGSNISAVEYCIDKLGDLEFSVHILMHICIIMQLDVSVKK